MGSTVTDRITGLSTSVAVKAPVQDFTTANITLEGLGVQAGGNWGATLTAGDRILVRAQSTASENGIYVVDTTEWKRAKDFDGKRDVVEGTIVPIGPTGKQYRVTTANPITIGTTGIQFAEVPRADVESLDSIAEGSFGVLIEEGKLYQAAGWHAGSEVGGGDFVGRASIAKSQHNGGTIISPTVPKVSAQTGATLAERRDNYIAGAGETDAAGTGVFERQELHDLKAEDFGYLDSGSNTAVFNAVFAAGNSSNATYRGNGNIATTLDIPRFESLSSESESSIPQYALTWTGTSGVMVQADSNQRYHSIVLDGVSVPVGSIGMQLGRDGNFEAYTTLNSSVVRNFETGLRISNCFDHALEQVRVEGNTTGIHIDPVAFTGDGGYVTTLSLKRMYVTNNAGHGLLDESPVQAKMLYIGDNSVFETNGDGTRAQIKIKSAQVANIDNVYIEDPSDTATGIEMVKGRVANAYFNGFNYGIDFGTGPCNAEIDNVVFASGLNAPIRANGGALATYLKMNRVQLTAAPDTNAGHVIYDGCNGTLPAGIPEYSTVHTGTVPKFGVGTTPAITRNIEAHLHSDAGTTVNANSQYRFNVTLPVGRITAGNSALSVTPQAQTPSGLQVTVERNTDTTARVVVSNITTAAITLPALDYLVRVEQFFQIN